jgi:hypothetical protein
VVKCPITIKKMKEGINSVLEWEWEMGNKGKEGYTQRRATSSACNGGASTWYLYGGGMVGSPSRVAASWNQPV